MRSRRDAGVPLGGRARRKIINNRHYSRSSTKLSNTGAMDGLVAARRFVKNCERFCVSDIARFSRHVAVARRFIIDTSIDE